MAGQTDDLELKDLGHYHGSEGYHNVSGANVTDGIIYIMSNGYSWFVTDMIAVLMYKGSPEINKARFLSIKLKVQDSKAVATIEDGDGNVLHRQEYEYTDAKRDLTLYYQHKVLCLPSEN